MSAALALTLPGVTSWARPRRMGGQMRYPKGYAAAREAWGLVVRHAVGEAGWVCPATTDTRFMVNLLVWGGGKRDVDRIGTAALDALQNGGAIKDDCAVDHLTLIRYRPKRGEPPRVDVRVSVLEGRG